MAPGSSRTAESMAALGQGPPLGRWQAEEARRPDAAGSIEVRPVGSAEPIGGPIHRYANFDHRGRGLRGSHAVAGLKQQGHEVHGLDDFRAGRPDAPEQLGVPFHMLDAE